MIRSQHFKASYNSLVTGNKGAGKVRPNNRQTMLTQWKDIALLLVGFLLSIVGALIGAKIQRHLDRRRETKPLGRLLNFGADDLLFVFPHRELIKGPILPRTSTEDFIAMNNFISALLNAGWNRKTSVRDTHRMEQNDYKRNLVIICSPKSNDMTLKYQKFLQQKGLQAYFFEQNTTNDTWQIYDKDEVPYISKSWKQERDYLASGVDPHDLPSKRFEDWAIITKTSNPWNEKNKAVLVAGIRGIGTWGAAECVKKEWRQIYDKLPENDKDSDFSALLRVEYDNCDIVGLHVREVIPLKPR